MIFHKISDTIRLQKIANILRKDIVEMIGIGSRGHFGGSLSSADIVAALYFYAMDHDPENPGCRSVQINHDLPDRKGVARSIF